MTDQISKLGRPKSELKRTNILRAATQLFLENGYTHTSMNLVAHRAQVSKQTVYSHFQNKDALFSAVVTFKCEEYQLDQSHLAQPDIELKQAMLRIGEQFSRLMQDPQVSAMYRVLIGEANTNPHIAQLFYQAGPQRAIDILGGFIQHAPQFDLTEKEARYWSCTFFNWLKGEGHMRSLLGLPFNMSEEQQIKEVAKVTNRILAMIEREQ